MKQLTKQRNAGLVTLGLLIAASGCTTRRAAPQPPPPGYVQPGQAPPPAPAAQGPAAWPWLAFQLPAPLPAPGIFRPVNVQALVGSLGKSPCRPHEVSPGNWVGFDCTPPQFVLGALPFQRTQQFNSSVGAIPASVDHRATGLEGPVKNQGAVGTCTAVSLSTAMEHQLRKMRHTQNVSSLHIWSNYRIPSMGPAGDSNMNKRIAAEQVWPYDPAQACKMMERSYDSCGSAYDVTPNTASSDPQITASKSRADGAGLYTLVGVERLPSHDPNEIATIIAGGDSVWVAFNVNMDAWTTRNMVNNVIQDYTMTSSTGHAVVLSGYRTVGSQKQFLIHNSWGTSWGEGGYAWIGENMVRTQLRYAYRVRVADPAGGNTPNPTPGGNTCPNGAPAIGGLCLPALPGFGPPQPQPNPNPGSNQSGCPAGQTKDLLSGQCVNACANGTPAIGGMCLPHVQPK